MEIFFNFLPSYIMSHTESRLFPLSHLHAVSMGPAPTFFDELNNGNAVVKELLSDHSGILENMSKTWQCFFTSSRTKLLPGQTLSTALRPGARVQLNAQLIDSKRQIQYLASLVWNKKDFPRQGRKEGRQRDSRRCVIVARSRAFGDGFSLRDSTF